MPGQLGTDFYRMVLERARDLLTALHKEVLQQEQDKTFVNDYRTNENQSKKEKQVLESKIYNMAEAVEISKPSAPSNTMSPSSHRRYTEEHTIITLPKVDEDEYEDAIRNLVKSGKSIDKSHIREFLSFVHPEPIISKLFQVIAIIKGYKNPNWVKIRDMLSHPTFKFELLSFKGQDYDSENVSKAFRLFESSAISFTQKSPRKKDFYQKFYELLPKISDGSVYIFDWIISFFKAYSGYSQFGKLTGYNVDMNDDPKQIVLRTNMKVRQEIARNKKPGVRKIQPIKVPPLKKSEFMSPEGKADKDFYGLSVEGSEQGEPQDENPSSVKGKKNVKKPSIGIFLQNKQMMFGDNSLVPQKGAKSSLIDYNAYKRGGSYLIDEEEEIKRKEQEEQDREERKKMVVEKNKKFRVDSLPNKTENMLEILKDIDYEEQPLETLISLAEKLKQKRLEMFPESNFS